MSNIFLITIPQPLFLLLIGIIVVLFIGWIFLPEKGLLALIEKYQQANEKTDLEHTLKYLYDCEYKNIVCKEKKLQEKLDLSDEKFKELIEKLVHLDLLTEENGMLKLTDRGRSYSLRIIRIHRIWEQYLADTTGVEPNEWHYEADKAEHKISVEEANEIASKLGNPVFDPHGDPIPTKKGEMPQSIGKPLNSFEEGDILTITHIEDEPEDIYEQLLLEGLYPGMKIHLTDKTENRIVFVADGNEVILTPHFASQITTEKLTEKIDVLEKDVKTLSTLKVGESAKIVGISNLCKGQQRRRLMDLGFIAGSKITPVFQSASGDPIGYNILGTTIGLRNQQAEQIFIKQDNE